MEHSTLPYIKPHFSYYKLNLHMDLVSIFYMNSIFEVNKVFWAIKLHKSESELFAYEFD